MDDELQKVERHLKLAISELESRMVLHMTYQREERATAKEEMNRRLAGMNEFRDQLREQADRFATSEALEAMDERIRVQLMGIRELFEKRSDIALAKIEDLQKVITPHLGPRVNALEVAKSNLEGRIWAVAAIVILIQIGLQLWPYLKPH